MKSKNYNLRSSIYKLLGLLVIGLGSAGSFLGYQAYNNWNEFEANIEQVTVVEEATMKLNPYVSFPLLIGMIVFVLITRKRNKEFFQEKLSMNLLIAVAMTYFMYSIIEMTLFALLGAFGGSLIDGIFFTPMARRAKIKAIENHEIDMEYTKEMNRIRARKAAREGYDGSV